MVQLYCTVQSKDNFKLSNSGQDINVLCVHIAHSVVKCVRSNGQGPICGVVKRSSNKNNGQNFLTLVAAVTTAPMGVTTPWKCSISVDEHSDVFFWGKETSSSFQWLLSWLLHEWRGRLSVTNLSSENNWLTFRLNAPVVISAKVKKCEQMLLFIAMKIHIIGGQRLWGLLLPPCLPITAIQ